MTYPGIAAVQDILASRILIEKVVTSLRGQATPDREVIDRLAARLSDAGSAGRLFSHRTRPSVGTTSRLTTMMPAAEQATGTPPAPEAEAVPLLQKLATKPLEEDEVSKLVDLLSRVDHALNRSRTKMAGSRYL